MKTFSLSLVLFTQILLGQLSQSTLIQSPHNLSGDSTQIELNLCRNCHFSAERVNGISQFDPSDAALNFTTDEVCIGCHDGTISKSFPIGLIDDPSQVSMSHFSHKFITSKTGLPVELGGEIHCGTCHNPHDNSNGLFLRSPKEQLCKSCHSSHETPLSVHLNPLSADLLNESMECTQCHHIHQISSLPSFLHTSENTLCMECHDGLMNDNHEIPSKKNLNHALNKMFVHVGGGYSKDKHSIESVTCSDCHDVHQAQESDMGLMDGSLYGTSGLTSWGVNQETADHEYQICYKCHAYSNLQTTTNIAEKFNPSNRSFHPIESLSQNQNAKLSLKTGIHSSLLMDCSDCHGNDDVFEAQGIHGSKFEGILKSRYNSSPFTIDSPEADNALCFECHESSFILDSGGFRWHKLHVENGNYNCTACHDSHGSRNYPSLLEFDQPFIQQNPDGTFEFIQTMDGSGSCSMTCHGHVHQEAKY